VHVGVVNMSASWPHRFIRLAEHVAQWSKDPSTKVGAVIIRPDKKVAGLGYNGFPRGIADINLDDRNHKYPRMVHAEVNAILNAHGSVQGCSLFTWPLPPCDRCATFIIQAGIISVASPKSSEDVENRWAKSLGIAHELLKEAGVTFNYVEF